MTAPLTMPERLRNRWRRALAAGKPRQVRKTWAAGDDRVCAVGLLAEMLGQDPWRDGPRLSEAYGLQQVVQANDDGRSFGWIAAHLPELIAGTFHRDVPEPPLRHRQLRQQLLTLQQRQEETERAARVRWQQPQEEPPQPQHVYVLRLD